MHDMERAMEERARVYESRYSARDRYHHDPEFAQVVDMLYSLIARTNFTPTELREAVILAATKYEMERPSSSFLVRK